MKQVSILGAGLAGTMMAIFLARRGYQVDLIEARPDLRKDAVDYGRSINLALSCRGITGLKAAGLFEKVKNIIVPMRARAIHQVDGDVDYQPFGRHEDEYINAIQRNELNALLLDEAESHDSIRLFFKTSPEKIDIHHKKIYFNEASALGSEYQYHRLIGADGAASMLRDVLKQEGVVDASRNFLSYGYKELSISPSGGKDMAKEHLHIWPRQSYLLLGNPNVDGSITGSLFLANEGDSSFAALDSEAKIDAFFKNTFADAYPNMPDLIEEFLTHPVGNLGTVNCAPWYYRDECLLIGDAAHGIVPFFGQGMNSAFEDCRVLNELLDEHNDDWAKVIPLFYEQRKPNTDAVAAMSMDNFEEIEAGIADEKFNLRKNLEFELMRRFPKRYVSKHILVMFTNTPYAKAKAYGEVQYEFLHQISANINSLDTVNWQEIEMEMVKYDKIMSEIIG